MIGTKTSRVNVQTTGQVGQTGVKLWGVSSFSEEGKFYEVRYVPGRGYICTCPFFLIKHKRCDHIARVTHDKLRFHGKGR